MTPPAARAAPALAASIVAFFGVCAALFAARQAIWLDETTQLAGLSLPFGEQLRWLTGRTDAGLDVLPDRMPPLSYWLGGLWARLFGLSEASMRAFGILCALLAAPALWKAGRLAGGAAGGLAMLALTLAAPGLVQIAGEIRAYPLFFLLSAWMVWAFARIVLAPQGAAPKRGLLLFSALSVAATYTHFFGIVAAGALFAGLLLHAVIRRRGALRVIAAGLLTLCLASGLAPFVAHATTVLAGGETLLGAVAPGRVAARAATLGLRLLGHPSMLVEPALLWGAVAATGSLLALAVLRLPEDARAAGPERAALAARLALLAPLAVAFPALAAAAFFIRGFEAMAPHYNIWMVPTLGLLSASAFRGGGRIGRTAGAAALAAGLCNAAGSALLVRHAALFSHGPGEWVAARIVAPEETRLVLDAADPWRHVYHPVAWLHGGKVAQRLRGPDGGPDAILRKAPPGQPPAAARPVGYEVRVWRLGHRALAAIARGEAPCAAPQGVEAAGAATFCAYVSASMRPLPPGAAR